MKRTRILFAILLSLVAIPLLAQQKEVVLKRAKGSVTFAVDENLPACNAYHLYEGDGKWLAEALAKDKNLVHPDEGLVACSFMNDRMAYGGKDLLFRTIVQCFAEHRPLVLSPDMVWLVIAQGFSHYVNEHATELRSQLVSHDGRMSLVVETKKALLSGNPDWADILNDFDRQIAAQSKGNIAQTITADFTTTGTTERIASQVTLMDVMQKYFEYIVAYISCGIPHITLKGTPEDWQKVHDKAMALEAYGLGWWTKDLDPIITEFVRAAEGHPNQAYWQEMVMKMTPERLRGGGCSMDKPTKLDGWFLKLFPFDKDGNRIPETIPHNKQMLSEMVDVPFRYIQIHGDGSATETPMRLHAGMVGVKEDSVNRALTPQIGWMVRIDEGQELLIQQMEEKGNKVGGDGGLELRVKEVPEALRSLKVINCLSLTFTGRIRLPEWMDKIQIGMFKIEGGELTHAEEEALKKRFPTLQFGHVTYLDEASLAMSLSSNPIGIVGAQEEQIYVGPEVMPSFPGGDEALYQWIYDHMQYPEACRQKDIQGRVMAKFVVEKDGSIGRVSITRSPDIEISSEASRLVLSMPKWNPGKDGGKPVRSFYNLPIMFRLSAQE